MKILIANWKMNPETVTEAVGLITQMQEAVRESKTQVIIAAPFVFLNAMRENIGIMKLGAQDVFWHGPVGAYTGEVSAAQLKHLGVSHVIVGHSERRALVGETDEMIHRKVNALLEAGLVPILCVGETTREEGGKFRQAKAQLQHALGEIDSSKVSQVLVTYEPVWAISTNKDAIAATPQDAASARAALKEFLFHQYGQEISDSIQILYGGSVTPQNIGSFLTEGNMDGALVGGASLDANSFSRIIKNIL